MSSPQTGSNIQNIADGNVETLLQLINGNVTMGPIKDFLRDTPYKISVNKPELIDNLERGLEEGEFTFSELAEFLDQYESYGHQHVFLYELNPHEVQPLEQRANVESIVGGLDTSIGVNEFDAVGLPEEPRIAGIGHTNDHLHVKWVAKRTYMKLVDKDEDDPDYDLVKRYEGLTQRRVNVLYVDFNECVAALRIHQLPDTSDYSNVKDRYIRRSYPFVDLQTSTVTEFQFSDAIITALEEDDARVQNVKIRTPDWASAGYSAPSRDDDVMDTQFLESLPSELRRLCEGERARIYWSNSALDSEVSTKLYEDRIAFTTAATEQEVEHVLQRIRALV